MQFEIGITSDLSTVPVEKHAVARASMRRSFGRCHRSHLPPRQQPGDHAAVVQRGAETGSADNDRSAMLSFSEL